MDAFMNLPPGTNLMTVPLAINPHGQPPNLVDPPSLEPAMLDVGIILIVTSGPLLTLRLYANAKHTRKLYLDDVFCGVGWLCAIAYWAITYSMIAGGSAGRHAWDTPIGRIIAPSYMKAMFAQTIFGHVNMWIVRTAVLLFYMRVFSSARWTRITCIIVIMLSAAFYVASIFISVGYCTPRAGKDWNSVSFAKCADPVVTKFSVASGAFNVLTDCITLVLPLPAISGLHISPRKKIGLLFIFCIAICTVVASCTALAYRVQVFEGVSDATWVAAKVIIASTCEQFGTVIVSCAPGLSCFWSTVFTKTRLYSSVRSSLGSRARQSSSSKSFTHRPDTHRVPVKQSSEKDPYRRYSDLELADEGGALL